MIAAWAADSKRGISINSYASHNVFERFVSVLICLMCRPPQILSLFARICLLHVSTVVFKSLQEYKKWAENKAPDECLTTTITFKKNPYVEYSWKRYNEGSKIERFSLEIYDEDTKELLVEKKYQIPAKALDFISAHLCPSDPKYNPTNICADRNCRATINDVDVTDYFIYNGL